MLLSIFHARRAVGRRARRRPPHAKGKDSAPRSSPRAHADPADVLLVGPIAGPSRRLFPRPRTERGPTQTSPRSPPYPTPTHARQQPSVIRRSDVDDAKPQPKTNAEEVDEDDVVQISSNLVPVPASVVDAQGRAVTDLQLKDFELIVDGEVKPIGDVSRAETPVSIALLYDNSSSLRAGREFEKQAAVRFLKSVVRPIDRAAVYSISTEPELAQPLTNNVRALVRTIENFGKPEGATALFDTLAAAADYLKPQSGRKVIVIVSDGTDTLSYLDFDTTMARVLADDCQVCAVQTGHSDSANLRDLAGERRLREFAGQTGGAVYAPRTQPDLERAFKQIAADLAQQYVLGYYPAGERRDGRFRAFSLRVTTRPNLRVRTRKGYYAPKG